LNSKQPEELTEALPSPSPKQQRYIQHESLFLLVSSLNKAIYVLPLTASILTVLFWPHINHVILGSWLVAIYVLSFIRYKVHNKINQPKSLNHNYSRWLKYMLTLDVSGGILVGCTSVFLVSFPQELQLLLIIVVIAISMESVASQSAIKVSFFAFTAPLFSCFILGLVLVGSSIFYILSVFAVLHAFFLYGNFVAMHHHIKTNFTLTFSNQQLAKQLKQKNQALITSNEQVNAISQAKSKFIISMSQELRVPLKGMLNLLENIQKNQHDSEQLSSLAIARTTGVRLLNLLNDLMDVYRLERGKLTPKFTVFEVRQHFEDIVQLIIINAHAKGLGVSCTIDSNVPAKIESDPVRLSQITLNLLTNAIKFTEQGQIDLKISSQVHGNQMTLNISVSDSGIGIAQDDINMIFQPFIQGKSDVEIPGNGLGLGISRELCQLLDGQMAVHSILGTGSVFSVEIPVKINQQSGLPSITSKKIILLVEGHNQHKISIEHQLRFLNLPCKTATNAKEAMTTCAENRNKIAAVIIGHQPELQKKLLINLCNRLKLQSVELFEFSKGNTIDQSALNYPIKLAQLKHIINDVNKD
jgi:signal transduction histidine kinase